MQSASEVVASLGCRTDNSSIPPNVENLGWPSLLYRVSKCRALRTMFGFERCSDGEREKWRARIRTRQRKRPPSFDQQTHVTVFICHSLCALSAQAPPSHARLFLEKTPTLTATTTRLETSSSLAAAIASDAHHDDHVGGMTAEYVDYCPKRVCIQLRYKNNGDAVFSSLILSVSDAGILSSPPGKLEATSTRCRFPLRSPLSFCLGLGLGDRFSGILQLTRILGRFRLGL